MLMQKFPKLILRKLNPLLVPILDQIHYIGGKIEELRLQAGDLDDYRKVILNLWLAKSNSANPWTILKSQIIDECASMQFAGSDTVHSWKRMYDGNIPSLKDSDAIEENTAGIGCFAGGGDEV